jgi:hypothetical protein
MNKIKQVSNAIAVWIANLLRFKPTNWQTSIEQADAMAADVAREVSYEVVDIVLESGESVNVMPVVSPLAYFLHALSEFSVGAAGAWFGYQIIKIFIRIALALFPFALLTIGVLALFSWIKKFSAAMADDVVAA